MTTAAPSLLKLATAAMGTRFELVLAGADPSGLRAAGESALAEIERLHAQLTRFSSDSLLSHINRTAATAPVRLDADTFALFQDALAVHRASAGAFDCTLGTGMRHVRLDPETRTIRFSEATRVRLDLGAIAKGHALDCAGRILRENGVESALLHGGTSSVLAIGAPPDQSAWRIALAHHPHQPIIELCDNALSVSCTLGDRTHNPGHIVDPRRHTPIHAERHAAVVGPSARLADAWSTALVVPGQRPVSPGFPWKAWLW